MIYVDDFGHSFEHRDSEQPLQIFVALQKPSRVHLTAGDAIDGSSVRKLFSPYFRPPQVRIRAACEHGSAVAGLDKLRRQRLCIALDATCSVRRETMTNEKNPHERLFLSRQFPAALRI